MPPDAEGAIITDLYPQEDRKKTPGLRIYRQPDPSKVTIFPGTTPESAPPADDFPGTSLLELDKRVRDLVQVDSQTQQELPDQEPWDIEDAQAAAVTSTPQKPTQPTEFNEFEEDFPGDRERGETIIQVFPTPAFIEEDFEEEEFLLADNPLARFSPTFRDEIALAEGAITTHTMVPGETKFTFGEYDLSIEVEDHRFIDYEMERDAIKAELEVYYHLNPFADVRQIEEWVGNGDVVPLLLAGVLEPPAPSTGKFPHIDGGEILINTGAPRRLDFDPWRVDMDAFERHFKSLRTKKERLEARAYLRDGIPEYFILHGLYDMHDYYVGFDRRRGKGSGKSNTDRVSILPKKREEVSPRAEVVADYRTRPVIRVEITKTIVEMGRDSQTVQVSIEPLRNLSETLVREP